MALTLSAAMIGLSPVSAQEDATVGNSASSLAQMPESKDTTQNALDLLEEALQKDYQRWRDNIRRSSKKRPYKKK